MREITNKACFTLILLLGAMAAQAGYVLEWQSPADTEWVNLSDVEGPIPFNGYDVDGDGINEILTKHETAGSDDPRYYVFRAIDSRTYTELWTWSGLALDGYDHYSLKGFIDLDGDGANEAFIWHSVEYPSRVDSLYALDSATGAVEWVLVDQGISVESIQDIDDDGGLEIVIRRSDASEVNSIEVWGGNTEISAPSSPAIARLSQNHPNPFNPNTEIEYSLGHAGDVRLRVYSAAGREICTLVSAHQEAGTHSVTWNGRDDAGQLLSSGVYFYEISLDGNRSTRKMLLLK